MKTKSPSTLHIELNAVIVAVMDADPYLLTWQELDLPSGPFETEHRTLEQGLRSWAQARTGQSLGYVEQLYTFADKGRTTGRDRSVSIGYLALVYNKPTQDKDKSWSGWYDHFPWEDHRKGYPSMISKVIMPALQSWKNATKDLEAKRDRIERISIAFPVDHRQWNEELVLQRYELLWEVGLVEEAKAQSGKGQSTKSHSKKTLGVPMPHDHRRILATAIARLRGKIKYRPVVFELMPEKFTLLQLQLAVEALAGVRLHKQNFRRLVEAQGLVEETGAITHGASGRPAKLFAFRRRVLRERSVAGTKLAKS